MFERKWLVNPGESKTIDIDDVRRVKIGLIGGRVDVIGHDEPTTRVEVSGVTVKDLKITVNGDSLEIDHPQLDWDNFIAVFKSWTGKARADISVLVPREIALKLGTVSADALVSDIVSDARLSTVSGDLTADSVTGDIDLNTVSGELAVRNHHGAIKVNTVSGDVTASGTMGRVAIDGVSGNVFLDVVGIPDTIRSNTVSGDLTLRLDADVPARYKFNTVGGVFHVDNAVFRGASSHRFDYQDGPLDDRWTEVQANSVGGNASVVRRAPAKETSQPA